MIILKSLRQEIYFFLVLVLVCPIDEFQMAKYTGRERLHYCHSVKCISLHDYFKTARKKGRNVFQFPYHLKLAGASIKNFPEVVKQ